MEMNLIPKQPTLDNFAQAFTKIPLFRFILNSFLVAGCITLGQIISCSLRRLHCHFWTLRKKCDFYADHGDDDGAGRSDDYFQLFNGKRMGLAEFLQSAHHSIYHFRHGDLLFRQFYLTFPKSLYEAAKIDGCPNLVFIVRILIPLTKSAIGAMAVYTFINAYNMYMWPLLVTGTEEMRTVQIGISMLNSVDSQSITMVIAGVVMVILPSLFVFILGQKQLIRGMFSGAVKG